MSLTGVILGSLARTRISLRFLALRLPLIILSLSKGLVELDLSNKSQFRSTILLHSLKLGWNVVMRNVLSDSSSVGSSMGIGLRSSIRSEWYTLLNASLITLGG